MLRRVFRLPSGRSLRSARRPGRPRLLVERLENRCVPATTITNTGGTLTVSSNDSDNINVTIAATATPGAYNVTVTDVTNPSNSTASSVLGNITGIVISLGAGTDTVNLSGSGVSGTTLTGNLTITAQGALQVDNGINNGNFPTFSVS